MAKNDTDDVNGSDASKNIFAVGTLDPAGDLGILLKYRHRFVDFGQIN